MSKVLFLVFLAVFTNSNGTKVYLCNGPKSEAYHKIKNCHGLRKCSTKVESVDVDAAKAQKRKPCQWCWKK